MVVVVLVVVMVLLLLLLLLVVRVRRVSVVPTHTQRVRQSHFHSTVHTKQQFLPDRQTQVTPGATTSQMAKVKRHPTVGQGSRAPKNAKSFNN